MLDTYKSEYTTLGIALAGCYATAPNPYGKTYCSISIPDQRLNSYLGDLVDGGIVIDKRTVPEDDLYKYIVSGPMLQESLPSGTMSRVFSEGPVKVESLKDLKSFDYIALDLYCELWENLGARIGKRVGDSIHWNDGCIQPIPSVQDRWLQTR